MPNNDTENIYSTPYEGGEGNPIPATKISYDNTTSGLTADNAQEAIDEVAADVDKIVDGELYAFHHTEKISITPDTTKTIKENMTTLRNAVIEFLSGLTDPCWKAVTLCVNNEYLPPIYSGIITSQSFSTDFVRTLSTSNALIVRTAYMETSSQDYIETSVDSQGYTYTQKGLTTATDSDYFVTIDVYKKIGV